MIRFECDYLEGAHDSIIRALSETNYDQTPGYGVDVHCENARRIIRDLVGDEKAYVQFAVGGTQTNTIVLTSLLRPHEGVIAAVSGHIAVHESGAIEATGHKVITFPGTDGGKLSAGTVREYMETVNADGSKEHMVKPRAVYISHPTEFGTLYTKSELSALHEVCAQYGLYLFLDGARLGYALTGEGTDVNIRDIYQNTDVFYIGGTKTGALFGEAIVYNSAAPYEDFRYILKQRGGMLAKGRLLGIQFETLLEGGEDSIYYSICKEAVNKALRLKKALIKAGFVPYADSPTNQQFFIMPAAAVEKLKERFSFEMEGTCGNDLIVRFCTSWATKEENLVSLISEIERAGNEKF